MMLNNLAFFFLAMAGANAQLTTFTPEQADWQSFYDKADANPMVQNHTIDGALYIDHWIEWDKVPIDLETTHRLDVTDFICPSINTIRGLREVFYKHNPFADVHRPTKAEVDEWHRIVINHIRSLLGLSAPDQQVELDHCLFARALWGQEIAHDPTIWDNLYPESSCVGTTKKHCGMQFLPNAEDRSDYLPDSISTCHTDGSEGIIPAPKSDMPWSLKLVRGFCQVLHEETICGGHVGPFYRREKLGFSFWDWNKSDPDSIAILRVKGGGALIPRPATCDVCQGMTSSPISFRKTTEGQYLNSIDFKGGKETIALSVTSSTGYVAEGVRIYNTNRNWGWAHHLHQGRGKAMYIQQGGTTALDDNAGGGTIKMEFPKYVILSEIIAVGTTVPAKFVGSKDGDVVFSEVGQSGMVDINEFDMPEDRLIDTLEITLPAEGAIANIIYCIP